MPCVACGRWAASVPTCRQCLAGFSPGLRTRLPGGLLVAAAFAHTGTARRLVHLLKYRGLGRAADVLGDAVTPLVPNWAGALVPVPRVLTRLWRYGVDPALELARVVGRRMGIEVVPALEPAWWSRRRAGTAAAGRGLPRFRPRVPVPDGAVLVDDVLTTGTTLAAARAAIPDARAAVTATVAPTFRAVSRWSRYPPGHLYSEDEAQE